MYIPEEFVHYGMLCPDVVHLNQSGYQALTLAIMRPLLHMWDTENFVSE